MNLIKETNKMKERKVILSTLWIFLTANYIFCDLLSNMLPEFLKELLQGGLESGLQVNQKFLLGTAIFMEIPFVMIILSRVLRFRVNRWTNIIAATIMTFVQAGSLFLGTPTFHYIFYSIIEIGCTLLIIWLAWKWHNPEDSHNNKI